MALNHRLVGAHLWWCLKKKGPILEANVSEVSISQLRKQRFETGKVKQRQVGDLKPLEPHLSPLIRPARTWRSRPTARADAGLRAWTGAESESAVMSSRRAGPALRLAARNSGPGRRRGGSRPGSADSAPPGPVGPLASWHRMPEIIVCPKLPWRRVSVSRYRCRFGSFKFSESVTDSVLHRPSGFLPTYDIRVVGISKVGSAYCAY